MKIILDGRTSLTKLPKVLKEAITEVQSKVGLADATIKIERAEVVCLFNVEGEYSYATVEHDGVKELFTVAVKLDEKGNVIKAVDNEGKSFLDDYSRAMAKGENKEYEVITSIYNDTDLETVKVVDGGDIQEIIYRHIETDTTVVRYIKDGKLVGELAFDTAPENVIKQK